MRAPSPRAPHDTRRELQWASALHEVGMMVSHHDHHRHSAYVTRACRRAGLLAVAAARLADLVLAQRGGLRKVEASLSQEAFAWQAVCLRLAIIACHARADVEPGALTLKREGGRAALRVPSGWIETHPRTLHLLNEEALAWDEADRCGCRSNADPARDRMVAAGGCPPGAHAVAVGAARRLALRCSVSWPPSPNSLRELRSLRSNSGAESEHEARCARGHEPCASRRHRNRPRRTPPAASSTIGFSPRTRKPLPWQRCGRAAGGAPVRS
jgi:hypothetical protein